MRQRTLQEIERALVEGVLDDCGGNKRVAAARLGCSLKTVYNLLQRYANQGSRDQDSLQYGLQVLGRVRREREQ